MRNVRGQKLLLVIAMAMLSLCWHDGIAAEKNADDLEEALMMKLLEKRAKKRDDDDRPSRSDKADFKFLKSDDKNEISVAVVNDIKGMLKEPCLNLLASSELVAWSEFKDRLDKAKKALDMFEIKYKSELVSSGKVATPALPMATMPGAQSAQSFMYAKPAMPGATPAVIAAAKPAGMPGTMPGTMPGVIATAKPAGMPGVGAPGLPMVAPAVVPNNTMPGVRPVLAAKPATDEDEEEEDDESVKPAVGMPAAGMPAAGKPAIGMPVVAGGMPAAGAPGLVAPAGMPGQVTAPMGGMPQAMPVVKPLQGLVR